MCLKQSVFVVTGSFKGCQFKVRSHKNLNKTDFKPL